VLYESGDEHAEMAVIFDALRRAKVTGRIGTDVAARLISVLTDAQRGHLHAALRGPRNRLPPSVQEEEEMAIAWTYIQVVRQGLVPDRTPYVTVGNAYGASREEIRACRRRLPEAEALNRWRLFANLEARADPGLWKPLLDIAGGSYRERKEATAEKRDEKHKRAEASERIRKGIKGQN